MSDSDEGLRTFNEVKREEQERGTEDTDAFSKDNAPKLALIVQMRIYDVLMALLREASPEMAEVLHNVHSNGQIVGALPLLDLSGDEAG